MDELVRYRKLAYVELNVTDLERARAFYERMLGLQFVATGPMGELLFRCSDDHHSVVLHASGSAGLKRVGWILEDERQFVHLHRALERAGLAYEDVSSDECAMRTLGHTCRVVAPYVEATLEFGLRVEDGARYHFTPGPTSIQRLGHVVFSTPQYDQAVAFFRDTLNFRESDVLADTVTFFRAFPNPYHHGIGVARSLNRHLHHVNFMVTDIDDIGRGFNRLRRADVPIVFGPGRHPLSESIFLYFLEPDGMTLEYSYGMEEFPEVNARAARTFPMLPEWLDSWGSPHDPRFASTGKLEVHRAAAVGR